MRHTGMSPTDLSQLETGPFDAYWFPRLFLTIEDSEKNDDRNRNSQQPQQNSTTHDFDALLRLFRGLAVEMFVVGLCVVAGVVDDAVSMIRRRIERVELQWSTARIDNVMFGPSRDDDREASSDHCPNAIENRLTGPLLHAKELVELVDLRPDLFLGF